MQKFKEYVESKAPIFFIPSFGMFIYSPPQTGYVSQRIPHGFSKARGGFTPLPSESDLRLREWMNPPVDAYASISGMIWSAK